MWQRSFILIYDQYVNYSDLILLSFSQSLRNIMIPNKIISPLVVIMIFMYNQEHTQSILLQNGREQLPNVAQLWFVSSPP